MQAVRSTWPLAAALAILLVWGFDLAQAQEPSQKKASPQSKSVDDALLEDLDNELLEGLGGVKKTPGKSEPKPATPPDQPPEPVTDGEDVGMPSAEDDPLGYISQEMRTVEQLLTGREKRAETEQLQQRIVEDLAKLIEQAEQQRAQQAAQNQKQQQPSRRQTVQQPKPAGSNPNQTSSDPATDSTNRLGRAESAKPDADLFKGLLKDTWGNLPEREREQMLQSSREKFLPQYELLIERYYRRLAEERTK